MERIGLAPGTEIGGYVVLGPVGQGGMGAVYRVRDADGVQVALKLLHLHLTEGPARQRLTREVAVLQRVRHRGVARVLDAELDSAEAFIVTELVDGVDLASQVADRGPLSTAELADLADRLRDALAAVHDAGVLHRDLTPSNVLVTDDGPVLIDFGIAQFVEDSRVTSVGFVAGTPGYLGPEVLDGASPSQSADWWGWAATLVFAATGREPFGRGAVAAVLSRVRAGEVDLAGLDLRVAGPLAEALASDPLERPTPQEVVARLRAVAASPVPDQGCPPTMVVPGPGEVPRPTAVFADSSAQYEPLDDPDDLGEDEVDSEPEATDLGARDWAVLEENLPRPRRRAGSILAIGTLLVAAGVLVPGLTLLVAASLAVLVRSVGLDVRAVQLRRARRGGGRADRFRGVASWPWYLVRGLLGVLPAAIVAAAAVVVLGGSGWWALGTGRVDLAPLGPGQVAGDLPGQQEWVEHALLAFALAVGFVLLWFGPLSWMTRLGARWTLAAVAPPRAGATTLVLLALAGAVAALALQVSGLPITWWPLPVPPDLG